MDEIVIIIALILLNGIFAMSEIALISVRKSSLTTDVKSGSKVAKLALKLANEPDRFLSTIQIGITLIGILTGIYSGATLADDFSLILNTWGVSSVYSPIVAKSIIIVVVTYLTLIFGELVPKRIGLSVAERASKIVARPMYVLSLIAAPFVWILSKSTSTMFNILGIKDTDNKVTEEEIKSIVQEGMKDGEVQEVEQDIVERVFLLGDLKVNSIMTQRMDIIWLDLGMDKSQIKKVLEYKMFDMYPIKGCNKDNVTGVVFLKDLVLYLDKPDFKLDNFVRSAFYFHENMSIYKVLEDMKKEGVSRALVCDEFGICQGIVSLKDILEALLGSVNDTWKESNIIKRVENEGWMVDGQCPFHDFLSHFEQEGLYKNCYYHTVGGLILEFLERIPQTGERIQWKSFIFEIVDMDGVRIDKVLVNLIKESNTNEIKQ
ncbi:MAG: hemolysin family protein [Bacteroides uniformis]